MTMKRRLIMLVGIMAVMIAMILWCGVAGAEVQSGNYDGMDWSFDTETGVLTLGKAGETRILSASDTRSWPWNQYKSSTVQVDCAGDVSLNGSISGMFSGMSNCVSFDISGFDTTGVTNMGAMFAGCSAMESIDVSGFDTSNVTNMSAMFASCPNLTSLDVSSFDSSSVTTASGFASGCSALVSLNMDNWDFSGASSNSVLGGAFGGTTSLKEFSAKNWCHMPASWTNGFGTSWALSAVLDWIDVSNWDLDGVTSLNAFFMNTKAKEIRGLNTWNTAGITNMGSMFYGCSNIVSLNLSTFDTSSVTSATALMAGCTALTSVNMDGWDFSGFSSSSNFGGMLDNTTNIKEFSAKNWSNIPQSWTNGFGTGWNGSGNTFDWIDVTGWKLDNVTSLNGFFRSTKVKDIRGLETWNTESVTDMSNMFYECTDTSVLNVSQFDTSNVQYMSSMFYGCSSVSSLDLSGFDTGSLYSANNLMSGCSSLTSVNMDGWDFSRFTSSSGLNGMLSGTTNIKEFSAKNWAHIPQYWTYGFGTAWNGSGNTFDWIDVTGWDLTNTTSLNYLFYGTKVKEIRGLDTWNTASVTNMNYLFFQCELLTELDVTHFDTSNVQYMDYMFFQCRALTDLDLSNFNTASVTSMNYMFGYLDNMTTLDLSSFDMSNVSSMAYMLSLSSNIDTFVFGETFKFVGSSCSLSTGTSWQREETGVVYLYSDFNSNWNGTEQQGVYHRVEPLNAIIYSNGDCVFQRGATLDPDKGTVVTQVNNFESATSRTALFSSSYAERVERVIIKDPVTPVSTAGWFAGMRNCKSIEGIEKLNTAYTVSMQYMFHRCNSLTEIDVSGFNTSNVTNMDYLFSGCDHLLELDISNFDMQKINASSSYSIYGFVDWSVPYKGARAFRLRKLILGEKCVLTNSLPGYLWKNVETGIVYGTVDSTSVFPDSFNANPVGMAGTYVLDDDWSIFYENGDMVVQKGYSEDTDRGDVIICNNISWYVRRTGTTSIPWYTSYNSSGDALATKSLIKRMIFKDPLILYTGCSTFDGMVNLEEIIGLENIDTSNITNMQDMFRNCAANVDGVNLILPDSFDVSNVTSMYYMFNGCGFETIKFPSYFDTSNVECMANMFTYCPRLVSLDLPDGMTPVKLTGTYDTYSLKYFIRYCPKLEHISFPDTFDTSTVANMKYMLSDNVSLKEVVLPDCFQTDSATWSEGLSRFVSDCSSLEYIYFPEGFHVNASNDIKEMLARCNNLKMIYFPQSFDPNVSTYYKLKLPTPPTDDQYTGKWMSADESYGPWTPEEFNEYYDHEEMYGLWIWQGAPPPQYTIIFDPGEGASGAMQTQIVDMLEPFTLAQNGFFKPCGEFDYWDDGNGKTYADQAIIPANTYFADDVVTLRAVFHDRPFDVNMQNGVIDFSIKRDEKVLFSPIPAYTTYQVYEQTPFGWNLIVQTDASGIIMPEEESEALFLNKYDPLKVTVRFVGTKLMDGVVAEVDSFNFLLYEDDNLIDIVSVSDGGLIEFQPIIYEQTGTHHYYIREAVGNDVTISYDTHVEEITVEITSDGAGHLYADVTMDEDEILFENASKPGYLVLSKANAVNESRTGTFLYEIQFTTENGQPYELFSGDITYEERDEEISELPIGQPQPEKLKYTLTVQHISMGAGLSETVRKTETYQYCAGDIAVIHAVDTSDWSGTYFYQLDDVSSDAVRAANGTYKLLMPSDNITVQAKYNCYSKVGASVRWRGVDSSRPPLIFNVFANGEYVGSMNYVTTDPSVEYDESKYTYWPTYNSEGQSIAYTVELDEIPADYVLTTVLRNPPEFHQFDLIAGYRVHLIWDDYDNLYGLRCNSMDTVINSIGGGLYLVELNERGGWSYIIMSDNVNYRDHDYNVYPVETYVPDGYTVIYSSDDDTLDKYEYRMKLTSAAIKGAIIWNDNEDVAGLRPTSAVVHVMKDGVSIDSQIVKPAFGWRYSFTNLPLLENGELVKYEVYVEPVDGYSFVADGYNMNAELNVATISKSVWSANVNNKNATNLPLRSATSFKQSDLLSIDFLPDTAIRIDDQTTGCSIYFYMDGTDAFWWSDAAEVRLPSNSSSLFYGCNRLTSIDLSGLNTSHVVSMSDLFTTCSYLTNLNISEFDTSNVTDMSSMFYYCVRLQNLDLSHFDTSHVTSMRCMFYYLYYQRDSGSLNITSFDTSNVRDMWGMFQNCNCGNLDLSSFDTAKVTDMSYMFNYCPASRVCVSDLWTTDLVSDSSAMFGGFSRVVGGAGTAWNRNYPTDKTYARVDNPPDEPGYFTYKAAPMQP